MPPVGDNAPNFEAQTDAGEILRLSDFQGKRVVLYFYPRANTEGCTKEACGFRDDYSAYEGLDVVILGVSPDTVRKQSNFKNKYDLPFTLLADPDHEIADLYGVWGPKKFMGREFEGVLRTTFIIDEKGLIQSVFEGVKPAGHSQEILDAIRT
ncbi:MAG: thioredoxin-dependent thiol peroxidase [Anaerolineales bacterium]|nr:thioredoxin-dependent thiol peroxidase [Anaerolineales bacterium]